MERPVIQCDSQSTFSFVQKMVNLFCAVVLLMASTITPAVAQQAPPQIVVDNSAHGLHPELDRTQNGIDQINIVSPNGAGVSHNMFRNYNVSERGLILNNATRNAQTKIGGVILGNTNLHGRAAGTILNEVTGPLPSHILGYTEVAGKQAAVIVANPNGLTCNGCGFINTSRVTLATGHPEFNARGGVQAFSIHGGTVQFGEKGADFASVPVLDILSRNVRIAGPVSAQKANLVLGKNRVVYGTNEVTPLADDGSRKPELALDTAAMGGLYANSIYLIVNEAGAGVRVDGTMASNAGDMHLDSQGNLVLNGRLLAQGQVTVNTAGPVQVTSQGALEAGQALSVASGKGIANAGTMYAYGGQIQLAADGTITNTGHAVANAGPLTVQARSDVRNSGELGSRQGAVSLEGTGLRNDGGKLIAADGPLSLTLHGGDISNGNGLIQSSEGLTLTAGTLSNQGGTLLSGRGDVDLTAGSFRNEGGLVQAQGTLTARLGRYGSDEGSSLVAGGALHLSSPGVVHNEGVLASFGDMTLTASRLEGGSKSRLQGQRVEAHLGDGGLQNGGSLVGLTGLSLTGGGVLANSGELGARQGAVSLEGTGLRNDGGKLIAADGPLSLTLHGGDISNSNGLIQSSEGLTLTAGTLSNQGGTLLSGKGDVDLTAGSFRNEGGLVQAQGTLTARLGRYGSDEGSSLVAGGALHLSSPGVVHNEGV
ncbi:filamentous hemagglutinin N-terminal domain-containing protein, partial [Bombella mellum]